jgi:uncharacterized protein (DUF2147 family)
MRKLVLAAAILLGVSGAVSADPVFGLWQTAKDDNGDFGQIEMAACGDKICGTLVKSFNSSGQNTKSANVGRKIVWDMTATGEGAYGGGKIWSPDRDKTYSSKMQLKGDSLAVSGCILMICRDGGTWARVN